MSDATPRFTPPLPGKRNSARRVEEMVRVDHAGEYGAVAIYQGQRAVFKSLPHKARIARQLEEMEADEQHHLDTFERLIFERNARPTGPLPIGIPAGKVVDGREEETGAGQYHEKDHDRPAEARPTQPDQYACYGNHADPVG